MFNVQNKWPVGSHDSFFNKIADTLDIDVLMKLRVCENTKFWRFF